MFVFLFNLTLTPLLLSFLFTKLYNILLSNNSSFTLIVKSVLGKDFTSVYDSSTSFKKLIYSLEEINESFDAIE